ncbi:DUF456 domain-containing protein [Angustibacter sp. Root456]|uniref:DUF456 domain-containing protein n=1 Tax=Angustibacter sp. Root456 TaxID=1736539 RepID=UPI0006F9A73D|nr:DUF456 domain-containing protein [Angustibacter sp. Root456]KQX66464.1 hypothetical protein ASD06_03485 [Angustibacter sp. Root456]
MTPTDVVVGLVILVGLVGVVVPVLPGVLLVLGAIVAWVLERQDGVGWAVLAVAVVVFAVGQVAKYLLPGRRLKLAGVPARATWAGVALGVVGFFVIPVVGLPVGFVLGIYLAERARLRTHAAAWPSTLHALRAAGWSILIELASGLIMAGTWAVGVVVG